MLRGRIYIGDNIDGNEADNVWTVSLRKQLASNVYGSVLYGQTEVNTASGANFVFPAGGTDELKVLRAGLEFAL